MFSHIQMGNLFTLSLIRFMNLYFYLELNLKADTVDC